jgi:predicted PurR-regulated permease PerM
MRLRQRSGTAANEREQIEDGPSQGARSGSNDDVPVRRAKAEGDGEPEPEPFTIHMPVDIRSVSLTILGVVATIFILQHASSVLIPVVLGVLISYALSPLVGTMVRRRIPRAIAAAVAVSLFVGGIGVGVYTLSDEAMAIVSNVPEAARRLRERVVSQRRESGGALLQTVQEAAKEIEKTADVATKA